MSRSYLRHDSPFTVPALQIRLSPVDERTWSEPFNAIVDTGADLTVLPISIMHQLRIPSTGQGNLQSTWHDLHPVTFFLLDVNVEGLIFPAIQVAGDSESDEIILGRNVLNKLALFLDGPEEQTDLLDDATITRLRARRK